MTLVGTHWPVERLAFELRMAKKKNTSLKTVQTSMFELSESFKTQTKRVVETKIEPKIENVTDFKFHNTTWLHDNLGKDFAKIDNDMYFSHGGYFQEKMWSTWRKVQIMLYNAGR